MAETIEDRGSGSKWHYYNVKKDLVEQGGLEDKDVMVDPLSVDAHGCGGAHKGNPFTITWLPDTFLLVTSRGYDPELIDAFSRVVEYKPFARYREPDSGLITTEWDKKDPNLRYQVLLKKGKLELTRLLE